VILNLTVSPLKRDSIFRSICAGGSVVVGTNVYTQPGVYTDTLLMATCDSIVTLSLTVSDYKRDSISRTICEGQSVTIGSSVYSQPGSYRDTLSTATCDSIVILNLTVSPLKRDYIFRSICAGGSVVVGSNIYTQPGVYTDTLSTATCDSIVTLSLSVSDYKRDSITATICEGQSITVGSSVYSQTGIYRDTLSTATCDSIVILNLTVSDYKRNPIVQSICEGQSVRVGANTYTRTGIYTDTIPGLTCDSIITLDLTVISPPPANITATPTTVDPGGTVQLSASAAAVYQWSPIVSFNNSSIRNPAITLLNSSWIYLTVADSSGACIAQDSIFIVVKNTTPPNPCAGNTYIYLPNAFTPNGDRINDLFGIYANNITLDKFQVFNRWGQLVFQTTNIREQWDGTQKGKVSPGSYLYRVSYFDCNKSRYKTIQGSVLLIR
jgi:gliding motility-associated-like protein